MAAPVTTRRARAARYTAVFVGLGVLFVLAVFWNIHTGSVDISVREIWRILLHKSEVRREIELGTAGASTVSAYNIIWKIRLKRVLLAAVLGGALALSGFLLQTFFRNPIAGPFVLGISSGARMFLAIVTVALSATVTRVPLWITVAASFFGSMLTMLFALAFGRRTRNMSMLLVIGIMLSYICSAVTDFLINFADEADIVNLTHWSMGSFSGGSWQEVGVSALIVLPTALAVFLLSKPLSAYALGEGYAQSVGLDVRRFRLALIALSSVLSACVTAFAGPVSFVGIAVPHICRILLRSEKPILMVPASFLCGAVFCMVCDLVARTVFSPTELAVGTVTSAIGAPIVIWLMISRRREQKE